jgi:hypothetical protein
MSPTQALADKYRFVIIAPQSHDTRGWLAVQDNGSITPFTDDVKHVVRVACCARLNKRSSCHIQPSTAIYALRC